MSLIVTPKQLSHKAELYRQVAAYVSAGMSLREAVLGLSQAPPSRSLGRMCREAHARLEQGDTFTEALESVEADLPIFDLALLRAGEQSGRLDSVLKILAQYYEEKAQLVRHVISQAAYPVVVFHVAVLIFPVGYLQAVVLEGAVGAFLLQKLMVLLPIYLVIFLLLLAVRGNRGGEWRLLMERVLDRVPLLGRARRNLALARLAAALEGLLSAGVGMIESWEVAGAASGSERLRRQMPRWRRQMESGVTPAELVRETAFFPDIFRSLYGTGEMTGQLDETLKRLYAHHRDEGSRKMEQVAGAAPKILYFLIVILVGYQVVKFYSDYYGQALGS